MLFKLFKLISLYFIFDTNFVTGQVCNEPDGCSYSGVCSSLGCVDKVRGWDPLNPERCIAYSFWVLDECCLDNMCVSSCSDLLPQWLNDDVGVFGSGAKPLMGSCGDEKCRKPGACPANVDKPSGPYSTDELCYTGLTNAGNCASGEYCDDSGDCSDEYCTLACGTRVPVGWSGYDEGTNYCNQCSCVISGGSPALGCTKVFCLNGQC